MTQDHVLTWGALQFAGPEAPATPYRIDAMAEGTTFDNPEPLLEVVKSLLTDGSLAVLQGWDNRDVVIRLKLSAAAGELEGPALAAAERALMAEVVGDTKSPLVWVPPVSGSATCVFDVVAARLDRDNEDGWDLEEVKRSDRFYTLTLTCLPFARPEDPVVVPALAPTPAVETHYTVDDGTSTTGWVASASAFGVRQRTNLVVNPTFRAYTMTSDGFVPDNWTLAGTATAARSVESSSGGPTEEALVWASSTGTSAIYSSTMPVTAGQSYIGSAYVKSSVLSGPGTQAIRIMWINSTGGVISQVTGSAMATTEPAFSRVSHTATAPAGAVKAKVAVVVTDESSYYVKQVLFEQSASLGAYFDGASAGSGSTSYSWTGTANASASISSIPPTAAVSSGSIVTTGEALGPVGNRSLTLTRTGTVSMEDTPYLRVSVAATYSAGSGSLVFGLGNGGTLTTVAPVAIVASAIAGYTDYYLESTGFDVFSVAAASSTLPTTTTVTLSVAHIERTDKISTGPTSTTRQQSRLTSVLGSAPTQAAVRLYDATPAALGGNILVHTSRNTAWQPNLRAWLTSSATVTADAAMVSGGYHTLTSATVYRIPASAITQGSYALLARMNVTTGGTLSWQARMVSSTGATTVGSSTVTSGSTTVAATSGYTVLTLASMALPVIAVESTQMIELTLTGTANMTLDEAWLFGLSDGALTWLRDTDSLSWIEIRSPELGAARPSVYGGTGALGDSSVCVDWKCESFGAHRFDPGTMQVFTVTTSSLVSQSELEFYPRYHSHVES